MKILNFGSCNIDYVYSMDHIVRPGETEATESLEIFPGGKGLNQSIALARAGAEVYHAGCVGEDGEMLREVLAESGVDVSFLRATEGKNGHAIIQVSKKGENSIFLYPGSNSKISEDFVDEVLGNFSEGDIILLQNEINDVERIVEKAYEKKLKIVLNPSPFNEFINKIDGKMLWCVILNEVEAKLFSGSDEPEMCLSCLLEKYPDLRIMLTLGVNGCVYRDKHETLFHPAFSVKAVDTTAAGDTFTGYFLAALARDISCAEAIRVASAASALAVSKMGAAPSIPCENEVIKALEYLKPGDCNKSSTVTIGDKIEEYIDSHLSDVTLSSLASALGYSTVYCGDLVKRKVGKPFSTYVQERRCAVAANLLRETETPIEDIIDRVGYKNQSFFRENFKKIYGKTPREYRKNKRGAKND